MKERNVLLARLRYGTGLITWPTNANIKRRQLSNLHLFTTLHDAISPMMSLNKFKSIASPTVIPTMKLYSSTYPNTRNVRGTCRAYSDGINLTMK